MKIAIGNDHTAIELKEIIKEFVESKGYEVIDLGTNSTESCDIRERPAQARDFRYDQRITPFHLTEQSPKFAVLFPFAATGHFRNPVVYDPIPTLGETPDLVLLVARILFPGAYP